MGDFMGIKQKLRYLATLVFCWVVASAVHAAPARAGASAHRLYVPVGYDDNDEVVVVVEGYLEETCQKIRGAKVSTSGNTFLVSPQYVVVSSQCDPLKTPFTLDVVLNPDEDLPADTYSVEAEGTSGKRIVEPLVIKKTESKSINDLPYAPVDQADVGFLSGGKMRALISGRLQNTCTVIDETQTRLSTSNDKTFEFLPVTMRLKVAPSGAPCQAKEHRFTVQRDFTPPGPGRFLLHVRTQSGASINRVFTNVW